MQYDVAAYCYMYSEVRIIRPPMVLVESGLNSEQVSLIRPICTEIYILVLNQVVLILARAILILGGLYCRTLPYYAITIFKTQ